MCSPKNARKPLWTDGWKEGRTDRPQNGHDWLDGPTDPCTGGKGVLWAYDGRTDGRTDVQPKNIMPPAPKGLGIMEIR